MVESFLLTPAITIHADFLHIAPHMITYNIWLIFLFNYNIFTTNFPYNATLSWCMV